MQSEVIKIIKNNTITLIITEKLCIIDKERAANELQS